MDVVLTTVMMMEAVVTLAGILLVKMLVVVVVVPNITIRGLWSKVIKSRKIQITGHAVKYLTC